jgi:hypothetical protein
MMPHMFYLLLPHHFVFCSVLRELLNEMVQPCKGSGLELHTKLKLKLKLKSIRWVIPLALWLRDVVVSSVEEVVRTTAE